jgi:DNA-binding transcriptional LysR family regulator
MAADRITSIEAFMRAWERGSFSAAARELGLTPASVGNHVRALEEWLGVRLLQRTTRRLALTEAGEQFLQSARSILDVAAETKAAAAALRATPRGMLRLSAPTSYGTRVLAAIVAGYLLDRPDMKIEVALSDRRVDLLEEGFDLAIRVGELSDSDLVAKRLAPAPFVLCAAPCYLRSAAKPTRYGLPARCRNRCRRG